MPAYPTPNLITNLVAGSDLSSAQYQAVILSSDGAVDVAGAGTAAIGFLMNSPEAGRVCEIASEGGGGKAIAGAVVTAGDFLTVTTSGKVIKAAGASQVIVARALESGVLNDVIPVEVIFTLAGTATA